MKDLLKIAIDAVLESGRQIMNVYNSEDDFDVKVKGDNSPLTKADLLSHKAIVGYLEKTNIPVLSEEGASIDYEKRKEWEFLWIVDPIDGTKEFIKKNGEFTVNIALVSQGKLLLGVVFAPALGDLYYSSTLEGAFKIENIDLDKEIAEQDCFNNPLRLPLKRQDLTYTVVASRSHMSSETKEYIETLQKKYGKVNTISKGSSLKLCLVAEGLADCYPRFAPTMEWDTAAGQAVCEQAGCTVLDWKTKKTMLYNRKELLNNWFLVTNN